MLTRARTSGLCHGCRQDLQSILERGFCGPAVTLRPRTIPLRWRTLESRQQLRSFTRTPRFLKEQSLPGFQEPESQPVDGNSTNADVESESAHLEVLQELEKALGRPIEDAIDEDRARSTQLDDFHSDGGLSTVADTGIARQTRDLLAGLRSSRVSDDEIARGARQIYGDRLPPNALNEQELKVYKRLYGEPASTSYEEYLEEGEAFEVDEDNTNELLDQEGEPILFDKSRQGFVQDDLLGEGESADGGPLKPVQGDIDLASTANMKPTLTSSAEERALEAAQLLDGQILEEQDQEQDEQEEPNERQHPFTRLGKFATTPSSVYLSQQDFVLPVQKIMSNFSNKHLKEMCERTFGGPGLPDSPLTPRSGRARPQVPIPLDASQHVMGEMEANAFITTIMPPTYAAIMSVLVESRKRLGSTWLTNLLAKEGGPRILDTGAGGAGIIAWREIVKAHWDSLHTSDRNPPPPPASKSVVLTGSDTLRHRAAALLENTTFIPRLPDYVHTRDTPTLEDDRPAQQRKQFDLIISSHSLFGLAEDWMRKQHIQNLWSMLSPEGGVLILVEKGVPRGFEAIAGARELLLERHIAVPDGKTTAYSSRQDPDDIHTPEKGMIVAPCTNHEKCPMYKTPGLSKGRKDFCSFQQRYVRPGYLQRILGAKERNHDDVDFSYLSVMRGDDLRQRQVQSWQGLEDGLSSPMHPDPRALGHEHDTWTDLAQAGFDGINPGTTLSDSTSAFPDGKTPSTLPTHWNLPRLVFTPMKRRGHVILDVCTPGGKIERWTVPRSFGKQAYRDARKSQWGDLWALGAKTRIPRVLKVGGLDTKEARKARSRSERLKEQAENLLEQMEEEKLAEMSEKRELNRIFEDGDLFDDVDDGVSSPPKKDMKPKQGKGQKGAATTPGVESFTFNDFNMDEINPPLPFMSKPRATASSSNESPQRERSFDKDKEDDDLSREELAALQELEASLTADPSNLKIRGRSAKRDARFLASQARKEGRKAGARGGRSV